MELHKPILLIEDDPYYVRLVAEAFNGSEGMFEVKSTSSLAGGLAMIDQVSPEAILVDLNVTDSSGYETFLRVRERSQGIPIIVLTGVDDDHLAVRAVEDGAQDYLVKSSIQPKVIARCMNMALSRQKQQNRGAPVIPSMVFSFIGTKGGVGTSTTAANIAALFARNGFETLAIELRQGSPGSFALYLPTEPTHGLNLLLDKQEDMLTTSDLQHCDQGTVPGLHLLCPAAFGGGQRALNATHVHRIISLARRAYQVVIVDLPAHIDESVEQALKLSDSVTMICDREWSSIHSGGAFVPQIRRASSQIKEVELALVDRSSLETPPSLNDVTTKLAMNPLMTIPHAAHAIAQSHSAKTPLVLLHPEDPFSLAHLELADHLLAPIAGAQELFRSSQTRFGAKATSPAKQLLAARLGLGVGDGRVDQPRRALDALA